MDRQFKNQGTVDTGFYDVIVVGSGPAGLAAATAASQAGASCALIEREERLGGILKQCIHDGFGVLRFKERLTGPEYACREATALRNTTVQAMLQAFVHSIERNDTGFTLVVVTPDNSVMRLGCRSLVMATGCRERTDRQVLLHGDRPAGIFTAGQAQRLININGVMPGKRAVVLGSGDIGMIMARRLTLEGAEVIGVYETKPEPSGLPRNVAQCLEDWNIPLHLSTTVTDVHGRDRVSAVTVCPIGAEGVPDRNHAERISCDTLILSVGLIPENDLLVELGVELDPRTRGPVVSQDRETSVPGIFVCGNALHVYDLVDYVSECGRIAGTAAAARAAVSAAGSRDSRAAERAAVPAAGAPGSEAAARTAARVAEPAAGAPGSVCIHTVGDLAYTVPQRLDGEGRAPVLFFRVTRRIERSRLEISVAGAEVFSKPYTYLSPTEMGRAAVHDSAWNKLRSVPPDPDRPGSTPPAAQKCRSPSTFQVEIRLIDETEPAGGAP